jgi:hypothetical protein
MSEQVVHVQTKDGTVVQLKMQHARCCKMLDSLLSITSDICDASAGSEDVPVPLEDVDAETLKLADKWLADFCARSEDDRAHVVVPVNPTEFDMELFSMYVEGNPVETYSRVERNVKLAVAANLLDCPPLLETLLRVSVDAVYMKPVEEIANGVVDLGVKLFPPPPPHSPPHEKKQKTEHV